MSRNQQLSGVMQSWGGYALYFCAMGALGAASLGLGGQLTGTIVALASKPDETTPRKVSRVEKHLALKETERNKIRPDRKRIVAAMTAPDVPASALAAAMDRTETASQIEFPAEHAAYQTARAPIAEPVRIAMVVPQVAQTSSILAFSALTYSAPTTAPLVAGIACSAAGCSDSGDTSMVMAMAVPLPATWPKPSRLGKGKQVSAATAGRPVSANERLKPVRKLSSASSPPLLNFAPSPPAFAESTIRIADSPGDIIRQSLRGTI